MDGLEGGKVVEDLVSDRPARTSISKSHPAHTNM